jgi:2-keto-3-deoxy-L-fuconate dehydrogenase
MAAGRLQNKTCFVTGAGQGIGASIVRLFLAEGATVVASDIQVPDRTCEAHNLHWITLDVTDEAAVLDAAARFPDVSVLVNCVGYVAAGTVLDLPMDEFARSMAINARSMALTIRAFLPAMIGRGQGSIVNIASVVSSVMAAPARFAYSASKAAVIGLTMSVARDFVTHGIRCNAISPGTVDSPSLQQRFDATGDSDGARQAFIARQPMGRLGKADEIAATALLLASDEAPFMTGSNIIIDGGMSL